MFNIEIMTLGKNSTVEIYSLMSESTSAITDTITKTFKETSLATTELFLSEVRSQSSVHSTPQRQVSQIPSDHLKLQASTLQVIESKIGKFYQSFLRKMLICQTNYKNYLDSSISKINRMDRNHEHSQGRLESRFDQIENAQTRLYKNTMTASRQILDVLPQFTERLGEINRIL